MGHWAISLNDNLAGILRAFAGLSIGWFIFDLSEKWERCGVEPTKITRCIFTFIEISLMLVAYLCTNKTGYTSIDLIIVTCFFISLLITCCDLSYSKMYNNKVLENIGRLSLPIYLFHPLVQEVVQNMFPNMLYYEKLIITIMIIVLGSTVIIKMSDSMGKLIYIVAKNSFIKKL